MNQPATSMSERAAVTEAANPANLALHEAAKQEVEASKEANKSAAGAAVGNVFSDATTAVGHAASWVGAKLTGETNTVTDTRGGAAPPMSAGAYGSAAAAQTGAGMPQGTVGGSYAPSPAVGQTEAEAHGEGFKTHAYKAMRGTGTALSYAKDALSDKLAANHYERNDGEQAAMQPKYPAVVTPVSGTTTGSATVRPP